jgi:hypothetical protein
MKNAYLLCGSIALFCALFLNAPWLILPSIWCFVPAFFYVVACVACQPFYPSKTLGCKGIHGMQVVFRGRHGKTAGLQDSSSGGILLAQAETSS